MKSSKKKKKSNVKEKKAKKTKKRQLSASDGAGLPRHTAKVAAKVPTPHKPLPVPPGLTDSWFQRRLTIALDSRFASLPAIPTLPRKPLPKPPAHSMNPRAPLKATSNRLNLGSSLSARLKGTTSHSQVGVRSKSTSSFSSMSNDSGEPAECLCILFAVVNGCPLRFSLRDLS